MDEIIMTQVKKVVSTCTTTINAEKTFIPINPLSFYKLAAQRWPYQLAPMWHLPPPPLQNRCWSPSITRQTLPAETASRGIPAGALISEKMAVRLPHLFPAAAWSSAREPADSKAPTA